MVYINIYIVREIDALHSLHLCLLCLPAASPPLSYSSCVTLCLIADLKRGVPEPEQSPASCSHFNNQVCFKCTALPSSHSRSLASTLTVCDHFHCSVFILLSLCFSMPVVTCYPSFALGISLWATPLRPHPQALVNPQDVISSTSFQPQLPGLNLRFPVAILKP